MAGLKVGPEGLPWPEGNPGGLRAAAGRAASMEAELNGQFGSFPSITGPLDWTGQASQNFGGTATAQSQALSQAARAFGQAAHALDHLAGVVEDAQYDVLAAARKLHTARAAETKAIKAAAAARLAADQARSSADAAAGTGPLGLIAEDQAQGAEQTARIVEGNAADAVAHSQQVQTWAMGVARHAVDRVTSADQRTAGELESLGLVGGDGPDAPSPGLGLLVTPLLGSPGALASLGRLVFGSAVGSRGALDTWLASPPPLPPPPPPPQKKSGGSPWAAVGLGIVAVGADVFAGAQLGLDPLADGAAGAADAAAIDAGAAALADGAAEGAAVDAAAGAAADAVPILTAEAADGSTVALTEEEQAAAQAWADELPTKATPVNDARGVYEVNQTGEDNLLMQGGDQQIWADGFRAEDGNALEAKYISKPGRSPFVEGSDAPQFIRDKAIADITSEVTRYGAVVTDAATPVRALEVVTNDPGAAQVFARIMQELGVPGRVVIRP